MAADNRLLDEFNLDGIPPAPRGVPQVEVKFDIDVNGILNVSAKDKATGKEHSVQIKQSSGLSPEEIDRMRKDADSHAEEDKKKQELATARNQASALVHQAEKTIRELGDKLDASSKSAVEASMEKVKKTAEGSDAAAIKTACDELMQASQALAQHMAADKGKSSETGAPSDGAGGGDDDVIDAEFEKK